MTNKLHSKKLSNGHLATLFSVANDTYDTAFASYLDFLVKFDIVRLTGIQPNGNRRYAVTPKGNALIEQIRIRTTEYEVPEQPKSVHAQECVVCGACYQPCDCYPKESPLQPEAGAGYSRDSPALSIEWLMAKYKRHGELEDLWAAENIRDLLADAEYGRGVRERREKALANGFGRSPLRSKK
jgi:predicted transcriptional regulator